MNKKVIAISAIILLALGYVAGRFTTPAKVETKVVEVEKEKVVTKTNVVTKTKEVTKPDGTIIKETETEDKSVSKTENTKENTSTVVVTSKPRNIVGGLYGKNTKDFDASYGGSFAKRISDTDLFGSLTVIKQPNELFVGIGLSYEF